MVTQVKFFIPILRELLPLHFLSHPALSQDFLKYSQLGLLWTVIKYRQDINDRSPPFHSHAILLLENGSTQLGVQLQSSPHSGDYVNHPETK